MKPLTFEEFAWRCLWLECGRMAQYYPDSYMPAKVRELKRRAEQSELWQPPYFEKSEWTGMIRIWYANYLKTGVL